MEDEALYTIGELARLGGVSRRTVRYYVEAGLMPAPLGLGRGGHYGAGHLDRLLRIKGMQEQGMSLQEVRGSLSRPLATKKAPPVPPDLPRSAWARIELAPGLELHVSSDLRIPAPHRLSELAEWCRRFIRQRQEKGTDVAL